MNKRLATWTAIAALVGGGLAGVPAQAEDRAPETIVTGTVTADGVPKAGVEVHLHDAKEDEVGHTAVTRADGTYSMSGMSDGPYYAVAYPSGDLEGFLPTHSGGSPRDAVAFEVLANRVTTVDIPLFTGVGRLEGRVVDAAGEPVMGAKVVAEARHRHGSGLALTDADGRYVVRDLPVDSYKVTVTTAKAVGAKSKTAKVRARSTVSAGTITLVQTGTLAFKIEDVASEWGGTRFTVFDAKGRWVQPVHRYMKGKYHMWRVPAGTYRVVLDGTNISKKVKVKKGNTVRAGTLTRPRGTTISGVVKTSEGKKAHYARVRATDKFGSSLPSARVDSRGRYTIRGAVSGTYRITLEPRQGVKNPDAPVTKTITVTKGKRAYANVRGLRGAKLTGTVVANKKGVEGIGVYAVKASGKDRGTTMGFAVTNAKGNYSLRGLPPGTYRVITEDMPAGGYLDAKSKKKYKLATGKAKKVATITVTD